MKKTQEEIDFEARHYYMPRLEGKPIGMKKIDHSLKVPFDELKQQALFSLRCNAKWVDIGMMPFLDRINSLYCFVTRMCCCGHGVDPIFVSMILSDHVPIEEVLKAASHSLLKNRCTVLAGHWENGHMVWFFQFKVEADFKVVMEEFCSELEGRFGWGSEKAVTG